jgi:hypothetical protein
MVSSSPVGKKEKEEKARADFFWFPDFEGKEVLWPPYGAARAAQFEFALSPVRLLESQDSPHIPISVYY